MTEQEVIAALQAGKKLYSDFVHRYFKIDKADNNVVIVFYKYEPTALCNYSLDLFIADYEPFLSDFRVEEKLIISEAFEALKQGKKVRRIGWSTHEYMYVKDNTDIVKHTDGLSISPVFISKLDNFLEDFYPENLFEIIEDEIVCKDKVARVNKQACAECNGTGVLDFGFYTRKCMNCSGN